MHYKRFGLMIATSTVVMFALMYLNTYAWEHVFFSETRVYMAVVMGAAMAFVMLAYMAGMYPSRGVNVAIFAGSIGVFAIALWLVRSQATISGESYMRAMIPHHSIAVLTSERAQIMDARVLKLAEEIVAAQRREIAEMRYLIAALAEGETGSRIYEDPPPVTGSIDDALSNTLIATLDPAPMPAAEADQALPARDRCAFNRSPKTDPIFWALADGSAGAIKLNGVIVTLDPLDDAGRYAADGATVDIRMLDDEADWRSDAELVFRLDAGLEVGYRGFFACPTGPTRG